MEAEEYRRLSSPVWRADQEDRVQRRVMTEFRDEYARPKATGFARSPRLWLGLGTAVVIAAGLVVLRQPPIPVRNAPLSDEPSAASAPRVLKLEDGSRVTLGQSAEVRLLQGGADGVRLRQHAGSVAYDVVHDELRPFIVEVGQLEVWDLGTLFSIDVSNDRVLVKVTRGRVEVREGGGRTVLAPGESFSGRIVSFQKAPPLLDADPKHPARPSASSVAGPLPSPQQRPNAPRDQVAELLATADAARKAGELLKADAALEKLLSQHAGDARSAIALFHLAGLRAQRGRHAEAAQLFGLYRIRAPRAPLAGDALAEEAVAWLNAGNSGRARAAAIEYQRAYKHGPHAERMQRIVAQ